MTDKKPISHIDGRKIVITENYKYRTKEAWLKYEKMGDTQKTLLWVEVFQDGVLISGAVKTHENIKKYIEELF